MLVAVVTLFAVAWTPFHFYALIGEFYYDLIKGRYFKMMDLLLRCFAMSSSCVNPVLYGWFNDNYKNAFISMVKPKSMTKNKNSSNINKTNVNSGPTNKTNGRISPNTNSRTEDVPMTEISARATPEISRNKPEATPLINDK